MSTVRTVSRKTYRDQITRNLVAPALAGLLARAKVPVIKYEDQTHVDKIVVPVNSAMEVRAAISDGYTVDSIETLPDGSAQAHLTKTAGIRYVS